MSGTNPYKTLPDSSEISGYLLLLFLVWPFLAFLFACKNFRNTASKKIILLFFALYGLLFFLNPSMDSQGRANSLKEIYREPFENLFKTFDTLYEDTIDFLEPVIMYTVSRFTDFYGALFAVYGLIFGSLMLFYLKKTHIHYTYNQNNNTVLFFILLLCTNSIFNITGFRMWTAAWIFAVGVMNYLHKPNFKHILFCACSFLMHFSFLPIVSLFVIYVFLKNNPKIYGMLALFTFFVAELNIEQVRQYATLLGTASETKITNYTNEEYVESITALDIQTVWYIQLINNGLKYFIIISLLVVFIETKGRFKTKITANFYSFTLLVLSFANISALLPSGGRFYVVFNIFACTTMVLYYVYENSKKKLSLMNKIGVPITALQIIFTLRLFSDSASAYLLGPSFMMPFGIIDNVSLQSILF